MRIEVFEDPGGDGYRWRLVGVLGEPQSDAFKTKARATQSATKLAAWLEENPQVEHPAD